MHDNGNYDYKLLRDRTDSGQASKGIQSLLGIVS